MKNKNDTKCRLYAMYNNKGITLIALVITIIVLLILAGVATFSGMEAIENSKYTKFKSELKIMQTYINNWYEECRDTDVTKFKQNIANKFTSFEDTSSNATVATSDTQAVTTLNTIGITDESAQSNYYVLKNEQKEALGVDIDGVTQDVIVSVLDRKVVSYLGLKYKDKMYYTLDDLGEFYNVDYDSTILSNNNETKPSISVSGKSVYYGETAKGAKYKFTFGITQGAPYVDKGTIYYSKLNDSNQTIGWKSTKDTELLVDRNGKYRFYYVDAAGNTSASVDYVIEPKAELIKGGNINIKMKTLSGTNNPGIGTDNTNIIEFKISNTRPSDTIINNPDNKVSTNGSQYDVYMWFDNGIIWLWSEENWISMNESSNSMFRMLKNIEKIDLYCFDTTNVTSLGELFFQNNALKNIDLSGFKTFNNKSTAGMFYSCQSLTNIDLSNINVQNVTTMESMFYNCINLKEIIFDNFNTNNIKNMRYMFWNCKKLEKLNLLSFNTSNATNMEFMFYNCSSLTNLNLNSFNTQNVTNMESMFNRCSALTYLDLSNFNTSNVTTMANMFFNCNKLTTIDISNFNTSKVTNMWKMFSNCTNLTTIYTNNNFVITALTNEQIVDQPEGNTTSTHLFTNCTSLVGGAGTIYDATHVDADYAHIDGGETNRGYFTRKPSI